jgi:hypothetical protein
MAAIRIKSWEVVLGSKTFTGALPRAHGVRQALEHMVEQVSDRLGAAHKGAIRDQVTALTFATTTGTYKHHTQVEVIGLMEMHQINDGQKVGERGAALVGG